MARKPFVNHKGDRALVEYTDVPILMPNELFDAFYHNYPQHFAKLMGDGVNNFWSQIKADDPKMWNHPMRAEARWQDTFLPLCVFGDGVSYTSHGNSLHCLCWSSMLGPGWRWTYVYLLVALPQVSCAAMKAWRMLAARDMDVHTAGL